ncbi:hypothetical protein FRB95_003570 [Tulasnella sp. JGI-2019a]|nr:hypothetical protein FRB95_003570 [Tulasnella sp. JGI-2019a]
MLNGTANSELVQNKGQQDVPGLPVIQAALCDESAYYNSTTSYLGNDGDSDSGKTEVPAKEVAAPSNAALANEDEGESGIAEESADIEAGGSGENFA